jgi:PAS domain S-box-containing protein
VETPGNVVMFRPLGDKSTVLTPVENSAFHELARQLSERLDRDHDEAEAAREASEAAAAAAQADASAPAQEDDAADAPAMPAPDWLAPPEAPARGESARDRLLLDLLPTGILIYRLDRLLYANAAFLARIGYPNLHALEQAGGLDALYVEPGVSAASSTSEAGTPMRISASEAGLPAEARLFTISWDGASALALLLDAGQSAPATPPALATANPEPTAAAVEPEPAAAAAPVPAPGHAAAEDLAAILDTTAEGILMFDAEGNIHACNRSAETLFGHDGPALLERHLADLFAPDSRRAVAEALESLKGACAPGGRDGGLAVEGQRADGGRVKLAMTLGRTRPQGANFFAVLRDRPEGDRSAGGETAPSRRLSERAAGAKADMLARLSHEIRAPLNAIIGFAEVMIGERFGALGNERYVEYMKDIRASGERVIAIVDDLNELSRIETGKIELSFTSQNLNDLVENCVAATQPQANRERIIIRTSLAPMLPPVMADARALRQITLNLIGNSIHLANPGGQVIVSTAISDFGDVVLRVRDTGQGLNDNEMAAALEPFRNAQPSDQASDHAGVNLSLTKALVEANRAQFHIRTGARTGTLVEVVFSRAIASRV